MHNEILLLIINLKNAANAESFKAWAISPFNYQGSYKIYYTDVSYSKTGSGRAIVFGDKMYKFMLPNNISNKSADLIANQQALKIVWYESNENYIILTDSKDAIASIKSVYNSDGIVLDRKITR